MIADDAINPFLAKALGLNDFKSLARYYVYSHAITSIRTSFGMKMEKTIKELFAGEKGEWWDVVRKTKERNYYVSVKSGPNDMNYDDGKTFADQAKKIRVNDPNAVTVVCMCYGKVDGMMSTAAKKMKDEGFDPKDYVMVGKKAYQFITGDPDFLDKMMSATAKIKSGKTGKTILETIDKKVKEITADFKKTYKDTGTLYVKTFESLPKKDRNKDVAKLAELWLLS